MLRSAAVFCILLLLIGSASALTINPSAAKVQKLPTATPTTVPATPLGVSRPAQALVTNSQQDTFITVHIQSDPSGADVTVDGADALMGKTPVTLALRPGLHTFLVTHTGYRQNTTTVNLKAGMPGQYFTVNLERLAVQGISPAVVSFSGALPTMPSPAATPRSLPGIPHPVPLSTPAPQSCPSSDWRCMPLAQAEALFGVPYAQYGNTPCGYIMNGSQTVPEYCCRDVPGGSISPLSLGSMGIQKTDPGLHIINRTMLKATNLSIPAKPPNANIQPQKDFVGVILEFFTGLFAKPVSCPQGMADCGNGCADINTDEKNCGFCGMTCFDPAVCCYGECVDLQTDETNCGFCGMTCFDPAICCRGSCEDSCPDVVVAVTPANNVVVAVTPANNVVVAVTPTNNVVVVVTP